MNLFTYTVLLIILGSIIIFTDSENSEKVSKKKWLLARLKKVFLRKKATSETMNNQGKISFDLKRDEIFGLEINVDLDVQEKTGAISGPELRVGQRWEEIIDPETKIVCTIEGRINVFPEYYRTKVLSYNSETTAHINEGDIFRKHFVVTDREIWACSKEGEDEIWFLRIMNKLHGTSEVIKKIFYFDGVDVEILPALSIEDKKIQTVAITDVRYLKPSGFKLLRYDGVLKLMEPSDDSTRPRMFIPIEVFEGERKEKGRILYQDNVGSKVKIFGKVGKVGDQLSVGLRWTKILGTNQDIAVCTRITDDPRLYTLKFLPEVRIRQTVENNTGSDAPETSESIYVPINLEEFPDYFTVTQQELWKCAAIQQQKDSDKIFLRRVTELIGRKPVKNIVYSESMDVWKYRLEAKSYSLKLREFYYFRPNSNEQVNFHGELQLLESETPHAVTSSRKEIYSVPDGKDYILPVPLNKKKS